MTAISRILTRIFAAGAGLSMALVFAIIFVNALRRYAFGDSMQWGEELPIYLTIYGVMFGVALAYLQDTHIRFTVLTDLISARLRRWIFAAMDLITVLVGAALLWSGWVFAIRRPEMTSSGLISSAQSLAETTGIEGLIWIGRMSTWQAALAFGGLLLLVAALVRFVLRLKEG